jgi:hypothetical protein
MAVTTPAYCSREDVKLALDVAETAIGNTRIDRAVQSVSREIEAFMHRQFYPQDTTRYFDWPNWQRAAPWRLWLDQYDLQVCTALVTGGVTIPLNQVFLEPVNKQAWEPYTRIDLDLSSSAAFGGTSATPQHAIAVTGTWGYTAELDAAGTLAAAVTTTAQTTITVSDGSLAGVGDHLTLDPGRGVAPFPSAAGYAGALQPYTGERVLVSDRAPSDTSQAQAGSGCSTASASDNALKVTTGSLYGVGEVLLLDQERMLVTDINGNVLTVKRAWDGTVLAAHSGAEVFAYRLLTVKRGVSGTAAATHSQGAAVSRHRVPSLIRDLAIAESLNRVLQETSGYARMVGAGDMAQPASGAGLAELWDEAETAYCRNSRIRVV